MNQLSDFLSAMRNFFDRHRMVESYYEISVIEQLEALGGEHRKAVSFPISFEIEDNMVAITYGVVVQDKVRGGDMQSYAKSLEQSIFVLSQMQDYMTSIDKDVEFTQGEFFGQFSPDNPENLPTVAVQVRALYHKPVYDSFDMA